MLINALSFLSGIMVFSSKNTLEISTLEWLVFWGVFLSIFTLFRRYQILWISWAIFLLGFAWMGYSSLQIINASVADIYLNRPVLVEGVIVDLPEVKKQKTKFIFNAKHPFKGRLKLSWYGDNLPSLQSGDGWQLLLKLKSNNGYQNSGGFDYEKWLFYQKINATGYVKKSEFNQRTKISKSLSIDKFRQNIRYKLRPFLAPLEFGGVINALIIGDRSMLSDAHWNLFKNTNTTHLSVISGLHIGLISGFVFLLMQWLWRHCTRCCLTLPAQVFGAYFGLLSAFLYALIAGFSIPTGRAFIMAGVVFISLIIRHHYNAWQLYGLALILVLVNNPLSVFSIGFWLSFYVVGVIIYGAAQHREKSWLYRLIYIQLLISIATLPLIAWFFASGSSLSPIANLIAIPVFSFIVTPLSLIGAVFILGDFVYLANLSFEISNQALIALAYGLKYLQQFDFNTWHYTQTSTLDLIIFVLAIFIVISPKGLKLRKLSIPILASIFLMPNDGIEKDSALVTVLDVGQGLAIVVQTQNHTLLFDTGAAYPSGFNLGDSVINPYLRSKHIKHLDKIIISHGDNDHIGGLPSVIETFSVDEILSSVPNKIKQHKHQVSACQTGQNWQWDGVKFEILNPTKNTKFTGNNASCVLKISTTRHSILLTADIENKAEQQLIKIAKNKLKSTLMIAPHHGSKTSSTQDFINAVLPSMVVVSNGYKNRFSHPSQKIINRYKANNISVIKTSCTGQIDIKLTSTIRIKKYRKNQASYYMRQC